MKRMKKILAVLLAAIMVMSLGTSVFAEETGSGSSTTTYSIKITNVATNQHTFEAYQIFYGTLSDDGTTLSNVVWGSGIVESLTVEENTIYTALAAISIDNSYPFTDSSGSALTTAAQVAEVLSGQQKDSAIAKAFATAISAYLTSAATGKSTTPTEKESDDTYTYTISSLSVGYYLVKDEDNSLADKTDVSYTAYILLLTDSDTSMEVKSEVASVSKVVATTEDGTGSEAVTANIGDTLYYTITVTVPDLTEYSSYALTISDTLSTGLTLTTSTDDVSVTCKATVNSTADSSVTLASNTDYTLTLSNADNKLTVKFSDIYSVLKTAGADLSKGATVTVTYKATLNSSAMVGTTGENSSTTAPYGNTNTVTLTYSNDPNDSSSTGTTTDTATVYTFELVITKTDATSNSVMENVTFKLMNSNSQYAKADSDGSITGWTSNESEAATFTTGSDGKITITGLEAGTYYLYETSTLDGYNLPTSPFTIVIGTESTSYALSGITSLTATVDGENATVDASKGTVSGGITNTKGSSLPTTGGIGTTIFYVVGAILVLGAGVVLITRRRMASR